MAPHLVSAEIGDRARVEDDAAADSELATTAPAGVPETALPARPASDGHQPVDWVDHEVFQYDPDIHRFPDAASASSHPTPYPSRLDRQPGRACAKMLVRAGHRCPTCFHLTSACRCRRAKVSRCFFSLSCLCSCLILHECPPLSSISQAERPKLRPRLVSHTFCGTGQSARIFVAGQHSVSYPHPCQWQVLYRDYSRRQRRLSLRRRVLCSPASELVWHAVGLLRRWLAPCEARG